jgi:hypothetical protein
MAWLLTQQAPEMIEPDRVLLGYPREDTFITAVHQPSPLIPPRLPLSLILPFWLTHARRLLFPISENARFRKYQSKKSLQPI